MFKNTILSAVLFFGFLLTACGEKAASTPETADPILTSTPDLCSAENLPGEVAKLNKLTREFDDYSELASSTPQAQLIQIIPELQRILRDAEDQSVPACLNDLKQLQLDHMNIVVQTLMSFMSATDDTGLDLINAGIAQARELHEKYDIEMASLLGVTMAAPSAPTPVSTP